ncbi:MAG TPA: HD domain-containing phosphohydrolase [Candidatus Dormibacteraeota bacterium]
MQFRHSRRQIDPALWKRHPALSRSLRAAIVIVPIGASFLIAILLSNLLPRATSPLTAAFWIAVVIGGSLLTLVAFERGARQLLPLAALLNVSLLFPDKAPARFAVARRIGSPSHLRAQLEQAHAAGHQDDAKGMQTVIELVLALSVHDKATRGHSERVRVFTDMIADELKIDEVDKAKLRWAALLHDVGKLEISPAILNKPSAPSPEEWDAIHRHPEDGARLVAPLLAWLGDWGRAVVEHHERWDGTGYPHGLKGNEISLAARIVSVADVYEVMTSPRPYKTTMSVAAARVELTRVAGTQLDPAIVRAFLNISIGRLWRTVGIGAWIALIPNIGRLWSEFGGIGTWIGSGALSTITATVLTIGGFAPPIPSPGPHGASPSAISAPSLSPTPPAGGTGASSPPPPGPQPTGAPTVPPTSTPKSGPGPTPTPTPTANPPTPTPTPVDWTTCTTCTNPSPACTSHCSNSTPKCTTYCEGPSNSHCATYCYGPNNPRCTNHCVGGNNPQCRTFCRATSTMAVLTRWETSGQIAPVPERVNSLQRYLFRSDRVLPELV